MVCVTPREGESVEALADRMVGDGQIGEVDRDAIVEFAAYLRATAVHGAPSTWGPNLLARHRHALNLTWADIHRIEAQVSAGTRGWPGESR